MPDSKNHGISPDLRIHLNRIQSDLTRELTAALTGLVVLETIGIAAREGMDPGLTADALEFVTEHLTPHLIAALEQCGRMDISPQESPGVEKPG